MVSALVGLLALLAFSIVQAQQLERVKRVIDGDTIQLESGERIRLLGVNTPETKHPTKKVKAFGKEASAFTRRMAEGKLVRIELIPMASKRDRYSRTLAYVFLQDGTHLNTDSFPSIMAKIPHAAESLPSRNPAMIDARLQ